MLQHLMASADRPDSWFTTFLDAHPSLTALLAVVILFVSGCIEGPILGDRDLACATWTTGLLIVVIWVGYSLTPLRMVGATTTLLVGISLIVKYYRRGRT
jgi:hypothetical protein